MMIYVAICHSSLVYLVYLFFDEIFCKNLKDCNVILMLLFENIFTYVLVYHVDYFQLETEKASYKAFEARYILTLSWLFSVTDSVTHHLFNKL